MHTWINIQKTLRGKNDNLLLSFIELQNTQLRRAALRSYYKSTYQNMEPSSIYALPTN